MVGEQRGEVVGQLPGQVQPADLGDLRGRMGVPDPRGREDRSLDLRRGLVGGVREPDAQEHQFVRREDDSDFFRELPGRRLGGGLASLGLAAGMHELVRAAFADGEEAPGLVEDADGGDNDERVHARRVHAVASSVRSNTDVSSWSLAGPVTSHW